MIFIKIFIRFPLFERTTARRTVEIKQIKFIIKFPIKVIHTCSKYSVKEEIQILPMKHTVFFFPDLIGHSAAFPLNFLPIAANAFCFGRRTMYHGFNFDFIVTRLTEDRFP